MTQIIALWSSWMVAMLWQVGLLVVIVTGIDMSIRRWAWPQVRHALWLLVLVKLMIPPTWSLPSGVVPLIGSGIAAPVEARWGDGGNRGQTDSAATSSSVAGNEVVANPGLSGVAPSRAPGWSWGLVAFVVWVGGMVVFALMLMQRMRRLARWHREQKERRTIPEWYYEILVATSQRLGLNRVPAIVFSDRAVAPAVYGLWRPVLLLPAHYTDSLSQAEARHVLLHELAHLKRGDLVVHAALLVLQIVYWFNPFVALARRQIKHVREICCDLTVANVLKEKTMEYRKTLVETARELLTTSPQPGLGLLGLFEEPYKVVARIRWLAVPTWKRRKLMLAAAWSVFLFAVPLLLPMSAGGAIGFEPTYGWQGTTLEDPAAGTATEQHMYVRQEFRVDDLFLGITYRSERVAISEMWIGRDIIAATERNRTTIIDLARNRLTFIDHGSETWAETALPLDVSALISEDGMRRHRQMRTSGEVRSTGHKRRILNRRCNEFEVSSWNTTAGGQLSNQTSFKVWATTDLPIDLGLVDTLLLNLRLIYNRDLAYRAELEKVKGVQLRMEGRRGGAYFGQRMVDEAVEISQGPPPPGTYEPPTDYRRVDRIDL